MESEFPRIAAKVWEKAKGDSEKNARKTTLRLEEQKRLKSELLRAKLRGEVSQPDYKQANVEFSRELVSLERQLREIGAANTSTDAFMRFVELALADIPAMWERANDDQRRRVRHILFSDGLLLNSEHELSNPSKCSLFSMLEEMMVEKMPNSNFGCPPGIRTPIC
jgi:hypothetical protein